MTATLTKTEKEVLIRIVEGQRAFGGSREIAACRKLAERGMVEVRFGVAERQTVKAYNFGREYKHVTTASVGALVSAMKIETAIARHGKAAVLKSING